MSSILSFFSGISILVLIISITNGFHNKIKSDLLKNTPHISITNYIDKDVKNLSYVIKMVKNNKNVKSVSAHIKKEAFIIKKKSIRSY